ncbi:MAG TPA: hypothetical protein VMV45_20880 [Casimicrobiaceae bacterium]|nr:hypothetical protein [Casimicrobiaceae bacterium]
MYDKAVREDGYVSNLERLWAWRPDAHEAFVAARMALNKSTSLSDRERAVLVCATARTMGDSYCSLAWGERLAKLASPEAAADLLGSGDARTLSARERALAAWARKVVDDPNGTQADDVAALHAARLTDQDIFDATLFIALRQAFSTVNDALGASPDRQLADSVPDAVRDAVTYGRAPGVEPSR